ncbi:MAG: twin-arginine translocase subunit TatB [Sphingobium sp.]|nr:twin-arginine translocase subunit TatB [Sphingobium sp.]
MFDIGSSELLMIVIVAIVVIGPKDLPRALYKVGQLVNKARSMSRHFRSGLDAMVREVELEEMEKKWAAENRRIMEQYPSRTSPADPDEPYQPASSLPQQETLSHDGDVAEGVSPSVASDGFVASPDQTDPSIVSVNADGVGPDLNKDVGKSA